MNKRILLFCFLMTLANAKTNAQDLQEKLLGKWKLTKDEGFEFFINSPMAQNMPDDEMEKFYELMKRFHDQSYKNFYSKDSITVAIIDRT